MTFLGTTIPANTPGPEALRIALDRLFNHPNTGPFFARQMIQRLVTSNPSPAYVGRVAAAFANNGAGVRGDLKAVWTAMLTDTEARTRLPQPTRLSGKLREPVVRFVQWARTVGITSTQRRLRDLRSVRRATRRSARARCVRRRCSTSSGPATCRPTPTSPRRAKQAPEFQLLNETTTAGYINFMQYITRATTTTTCGPTYSALLPIAHGRAGGDRLAQPAAHRESAVRRHADRVADALSAFNVTAASSDNAKLDMLAAACLLILCSPEYLVQK